MFLPSVHVFLCEFTPFFPQLPYFMDELTLTELAMGSSMPQITGTSLPQVNSRGEWGF